MFVVGPRIRGNAPKMSSIIKRSYFIPYKLSFFQRSFLVPFFGLGALNDPTRGDLVAGLGDVTASKSLERMCEKIKSTATGRTILERRPLVSTDSIDFNKLRSLESHTFGFAYAKFMDKHSYSPDERAVVRFQTNPEHAYVMTRYRQIHDFWHVLTGVPTTVVGEVGLKWFEWKVTGLPICLLSGVLGPLKLDLNDHSTLIRHYLPWVHRSGATCEQLMVYSYEQSFEKSLEEVRNELSIVPFGGPK